MLETLATQAITPQLVITDLRTREAEESVRQVIRKYNQYRVFIHGNSKRLKQFPFTLKFSPGKGKPIRPYWDGLIIDPTNANFKFRLYLDDCPTLELEYEKIKGILVPLRENGRLASTYYYSF